ncbi:MULTISPECIES: DUF5343 domain-containing protein [unclassified Caulobacter]|uniref:DUF5343 domain-containing protein n=1 Tax=unclassified Caulobacter TaxID=2648921 RepID=UPI000A71E10C|nr:MULTISPECIES: DUF5343 domain-containing protein [unclassified Caulobacter]
MAKGTGENSEQVSSDQSDSTENGKEKSERREIKGGIPYSTSPGVLKKALELIIPAERPDNFGANYMETILKLTGGSARAVPPFLKKMQFINADGTPTILYSKFKTDSGRSQAAYEGLKNAFGELFKRNEYIHKADEASVKDTIVEITGLKKTDSIVRLMYASFDAIRGFISGDVSQNDDPSKQENGRDSTGETNHEDNPPFRGKIGLSYQINIVLPETENIAVFNAIFKSLRDNLLR